tara:strand:- start:3917 stop:4990 length:1074 start_codon:yes stop_codon:yes gene_type:complete
MNPPSSVIELTNYLKSVSHRLFNYSSNEYQLPKQFMHPNLAALIISINENLRLKSLSCIFNKDTSFTLSLKNMIQYQSNNHGFYYKLINWLTRLSEDIEYGRSLSRAFTVTVTTDYSDIIRLSKQNNYKTNLLPKYRDTNCIFIHILYNILIPWTSLTKESKLMFRLNNSVLQMDFCEDVTLEKNIFDDYVVTLKFITYTDYYIGMRFTMPSSIDRTLDEIMCLSSDNTNFKVINNHSFHGVRIPCFQTPINNEYSLKNTEVSSWNIVPFMENNVLSLDKTGIYLGKSKNNYDNNNMWNETHLEKKNYLKFYQEDSSYCPENFNFFVEMFTINRNNVSEQSATIIAASIDESCMHIN